MKLAVSNIQELYNAIEVRQSRRKYKSQPIGQSQIETLRETVKAIEQEVSSVKIIIRPEGFERIIKNIFGFYGLISGAWSYAVILANKSAENYQVQAGYAGEALVLKATAMEIDTCWIGGFYNSDKIEKELELPQNHAIMSVIALGEAKAKKTISEKIMKKVTGSTKRKALSELCDSDFDQGWPDWIKSAIKAARLAPSAVNRQPWRFKVAGDKLTLYTGTEKDKGEVSPYLDCGIALLHLELGARNTGQPVEIKELRPPEVAEITPVEKGAD
ncbi:MAG: nitroreductase family protein [Halarsenatibacteraceae bacterium]